jgi:N-acetylmuramoyl-L-alanine amidase
VRDVQHRLVALGFAIGADESGAFGDGTVAAVRAFQEQRGLRVDGVCGRHTWSALVEAGWRLGDRPLFATMPMLRGDDVAELQRRLSCLGFDGGRLDGIFGVRTERALVDFQRNAGLVTDAICGPATLAALARLGGSAAGLGGGGTGPGLGQASVASVREREQHRRRPPSLAGRTVAIGEPGGLDALVRAVAAAVATAGGSPVRVQHPDESAQAAQANGLAVDAYVGLAVRSAAEGDGATASSSSSCSTAYYRSPSGWESPEGRRLAELVQAALLPVLGAEDGGVRGMAVPVLRETRMPAVLAELGAPATVVERSAELAAAIAAALQRWADHTTADALAGPA